MIVNINIVEIIMEGKPMAKTVTILQEMFGLFINDVRTDWDSFQLFQDILFIIVEIIMMEF